jgi:hypothetical protein
MDDQYFLFFIGLREDAKQKSERHKLWQKARRTLKKKEASKFRQKVTAKIKFVQPVTPMGIILPRALSIPIDGARVNETVMRIAKGLYFHETGSRLPGTHRVIAQDELALQNAPLERMEYVSEIRTLISQLQTMPRKTVGTVFAYHWDSKPAEPATTMWLLNFFDGIRFFCITQPTGNHLLPSPPP